MHKKLILLPIFMSVLATGCSGKNSESKPADNTFVMHKIKQQADDTTESDIFVKYEGEEAKELVSGAKGYVNVNYLEGDKSILLLDETYELSKYDKEGNVEKVAKNVTDLSGEISPYQLSNDNKTIAYLSDDDTLYIKEEGKDKVKVDEEVNFYHLDSTGKYVYYKDDDDNLRVYTNGESEKIASDAVYYGGDYSVSKNGDTVTFTNTDGELYIKNANKDDKEKVTSDSYIQPVLHEDGSISLIDDFETYGELCIYKDDEKERIASDVKEYVHVDDTYFYIDEDDNLFEKSIKDKESNKIDSDVTHIKATAKGVVYKDVENNIYVKNIKDKESKQIGKNVTEFYNLDVVDGEEVVYLDENSNLYINEEKISADVSSYVYNSKNIAYVNRNKEVHLYNIKKKKDTLEIQNAKEYSQIYFEDQYLFSNEVEPADLQGYWKTKSDVFDYVTKFTGKNKMTDYYSDGDRYDYTYEVNYSGYNYMNVTTDNGVTFTITLMDDNNILLEFTSEKIALFKITDENAQKFLSGKNIDIKDTVGDNIESSEEEVPSSESDDVQIEKLITNYESAFVEAVNNGNFSYVIDYLVEDGPLYKEHSKHIVGFYEKGISEKLYTSIVETIEDKGNDTYKVSVYEKIGITKAGESENIREYNSVYIVVKQNGKFLIDEML